MTCALRRTKRGISKLAFSKALIAATCVLLAMVGAVAGQTAPRTRQEAHRRAEALLKQMTLEEKVGQLNEAAGIQIPGLGGEKPEAAITKGQHRPLRLRP